MTAPLRIIFRGDEAGSARSADLALRECIERGVVRNVGVMVPGPSFAHAVERFADVPAVLHGRGFVVEEALAEIAAQLDRAREAGLTIEHIDEHMGVS